MALARNFPADKAKQVRWQSDGTKQGCGDDRHMLVGPRGSGSDEYRYRSLVRFDQNWTGVKRLITAEIAVKTEDDSTHFTFGSKPKVRVNRLTDTFAEGTGAENVWSNSEWEAPPNTGTVDATLPLNPTTGAPQDEAWVFIDVTSLMKPFVPPSVTLPDGSAGTWKSGHNYGWIFRNPGKSETDNTQRAIFHSFHDGTAANRPYMRITYDPVNSAPTAPTLLAPGTDNVSFAESFEGQHVDPDGDPMASRVIQIRQKGTTTPVWTLDPTLQTAGSDETSTGRFSVPLSLAVGFVKSGTLYEWHAATRDSWGAPASDASLAYSAWRDLKVTSSAPSVIASPLQPVTDMSAARFGGKYTDPEDNPLAKFQMQMQAQSAHTDAAFADPGAFVWDTGEALATTDEITGKAVSRQYGGSPLGVGDWTYRIKVQDSTGVWSPWSYSNWHLSTAFTPDPGNATLTTQISRNAPTRIALYSVFTTVAKTTRAAGRGRGYLIGHLDDPMDLGASTYMNGGGEVYFSLPALHPYCPEIEPRQVHYAVEQWYGDRYRELPFSGLITDFDADTETVTFYGTDYLGMLQTAVDERYDPNKPDNPASGTGTGGSKYVNQTLDAVIKDQLRYHKALADSPVGFITVGTITALAERATIYSTYTEALPFITGIIDSHKQGTGRECRIYAKPNATYTGWEWTLADNWGKDRPNIRLEWGGLVNDFRLVALGEWGTRVLGVGNKRGEVKVYRAKGPNNAGDGLDEAVWGRTAKTAYFQDIVDQNDLQRRVNEAAAQLAKVGKRFALALRADMLQPFDGWDVGDSILIDIERGVVDTLGYGSGGYWTILGVEWRYSPDGHSDLTLTILPKKSLTDPDPDLIPSVNPGLPDKWQVGYGVPTTYGEPPINTPVPPALFAAPLADAEDVWRYRTGFTAPAAGQVKVNPGGTQLLVSKTSDEGWDRAAELLQLLIGSRIRLRSQGNLLRVWQITSAADAGSYLTLGVNPLLATGAYPANNQPVLASLRTVGTYAYYPPSDDPVVAEHYQDLNTGCVYEIDTAGVYTEVYCPDTGGGTAPYVPDTTSPGVPIIKSTTSQSVIQDDGSALTSLAAQVGYSTPPSGLTDLDQIAMQSTRFKRTDDPSLPDWSLATQWVTSSADQTGTLDTYVIQPSVHSATVYWLRAAAIDVWGNRSGWSDPVSIETATDLYGPPVPTGIVTEAGMSTIGVRWDDSDTPDLAYNEVRWRVAAPVGNWVVVRAEGTLIVITGLVNETTYDVQVRAIDTSGNVQRQTGLDGDLNPVYDTVKAVEFPDAGWISGADATPTALPGNAFVWDEAIIEDIFAGNIDADWITAGTLRVGSLANDQVAAIEVYDPSGKPVGRWSTEGIEVLDPANPAYRMVITEASLTIIDETNPLAPIETVRLTPLGIDAASITFGSSRGGHNLILNSSFELGAFGATTVVPSTWDVAAHWNAVGPPTSRVGADTNITTGATALTMTTVV